MMTIDYYSMSPVKVKDEDVERNVMKSKSYRTKA